MKVDETVRKETGYVAAGTVALSVAMEVVYAVLGRWDVTVLLGNLLGFAAAVANFFLMGLAVQKAVLMDEKDAALHIRLSQRLRLFMLAAVLMVAALAPCFALLSAIIPLFFPRLVVMVRGRMVK